MSPLLRYRLAAGLLVVLGLTTSDSEAVPKRFELRIPDEGSAAFTGDDIALTRERVRHLVIDILGSAAKEIESDKIYPKLNGEAASTISQVRRTRRGLAVVLDLEAKPHLRLVDGINTVEIVAENHRGRRFYRNWILRLRERADHEWFAFERMAGPGESNPSPPDVQVVSPVVPPVVEPETDKLTITFEAKISAYHPLEAIGIDGVSDPDAVGRMEARIEQRVTVPGSQRQVELFARDVRGNETRVRVPIRESVKARAPKLSGKRYLLAIGISTHQDSASSLPPLPGASQAAADLSRLLDERLGLEASLVLRDRDATLARVQSALRDFLAIPGPDDLLIVYVATYGFHGHGNGVDRTFLACWDTRLDLLSDTALSMDELSSRVNDAELVRSRNVLLLFEPRPVPGLDQELAGSNLVNAHLLRLFSADKGRTVMVSADVAQESRSKETEGGGLQGVFASALMTGLEGEADRDGDRILRVSELFRYVSDRVRIESGGAQVPRFRIAGGDGEVGSLTARGEAAEAPQESN